MRKGLNPLYRANAPQQMPITVATVTTHLPNTQGYHADRMAVVQACLLSMRAGAPDVPVLVWDNGSGDRLHDWLLKTYQPDYLVLSPNIGKFSARAAIARMFPESTVVGFADDDMLFYSGWWDESVKLMTGFPDVGVVSAWPVRVSFRWGSASVIRWAKAHGTLETGRFIPADQERDYAVSVGLDPAEHAARVAKDEDLLVSSKAGLMAYAEAQHCQFIAKAGVIAPFCDFSPMAMGAEMGFDKAIDKAGLLRLTTINRYARHMGNVLDDTLRAEIKGMKL